MTYEIIVFGASRGTGRHIVKLALAAGHEVTAVARTNSHLKSDPALARNPSLRIVEGDVLVPSTFAREIDGRDVVISTISVSANKPTTLYSKGTSNIIDVMARYNVPRLLCVSGIGVEVTPGMSLPLRLVTRYIVQPLFNNIFSDLLKMEEVVKQSSLDWTIVRAPRLVNRKLTARYRSVPDTHLDNPMSLGRLDLAHFIINSIASKKLIGTKVEVAY